MKRKRKPDGWLFSFGDEPPFLITSKKAAQAILAEYPDIRARAFVFIDGDVEQLPKPPHPLLPPLP